MAGGLLESKSSLIDDTVGHRAYYGLRVRCVKARDQVYSICGVIPSIAREIKAFSKACILPLAQLHSGA